MATATTRLDPSVVQRDKVFIDGEWVPANGERVEVENPATGEPIGYVVCSSLEDVDAAVEAAARAFSTWRLVPPGERAAHVAAFGRALDAYAETVADLVTAEIGVPRPASLDLWAKLPVQMMTDVEDFVDEIKWEEERGNSIIYRDPVGVVAAITPWNAPVHQMAVKLAPALTAGCTVVMKPSNLAPFTSYLIAQAAHDAGIPPGVVNLVIGDAVPVGEHLVGHPKVAIASFTGSVRGGARVGEIAASGIKRAVYELGGKSPCLILDDVTDDQLASAMDNTAFGNLMCAGQICEALSRVIVHRSKLEQVEQLAVEIMGSAKVGDPTDETTIVGPIISDVQKKRVIEYIDSGTAEGARLLLGGTEPPEDVPPGHYVQPTVFTDVRPEMRIAQEEIFGPVLSIMPFDGDDEEAIALANSTEYGLAAAVWSGDEERARRVARWIDSGQINVNGAPYDLRAPFGGFKKSGIGREAGPMAIEEFLQTRALQVTGVENEHALEIGVETL